VTGGGPADKGSHPGGLSAARHELIQRRLRERGFVPRPGQERIRPREGSGPAPLSLNQEGIWFIDRLDPGQPTYNIPGVVRLRGELDVTALEASLGEIVERHDTLRTVFELSEAGLPVQVVVPSKPFRLPVHDLSHLQHDDREAEVARRAREDAATPFDLGRGPLFTAFLLRLARGEHALILKVHHLVIDGWSWGILTQELKALYRAHARSEPASLPPLGLRYADFAVWQRTWQQGDAYEELVAYWKTRLQGVQPLVLPTDRPQPSTPTIRGKHHPMRISPETTGALRQVATERGHTLFVVLLAAFKMLLRHYAGQDDIVVGATFANRSRSELEDIVGYFVTLLPLRTEVRGDLDVDTLLERVSDATSGAISHQSLPLTRLVAELGLARDVGRTPLFQVVFYLLTPDHNPAVFGFGLPGTTEVIHMDGVELTPIETECGLSRFDLMFLLWDLPGGLHGTVEYSTDLFEDATIANMVEAFQALLPLLARRRGESVDELTRQLVGELADRRRQETDAAKKRMLDSLGRIKPRVRSDSSTKNPSGATSA
jgi:hypothetical protein